MSEAKKAITEAVAEYLETLYFEECPEEWGERPTMFETSNQIAEVIDLLQEVNPIASPDCVGHGTFFDYSPAPESSPEPIKPIFASRIKSALSAIFRRNATI